MPASFASFKTLRVTAGGVMMEREVLVASSKAFGDATVGYDFDPTVTSEARGLIGMTGNEWARYQTNTRHVS